MSAETSRLLVTFSLCALTLTLTVAVVFVFPILLELRRSLKKLNHILDHTSLIAESVSKPVVSLSNLLTSIGQTTHIVKKFISK